MTTNEHGLPVDTNNGVPFIDQGGHRRYLAKLAPRPNFGAFPVWSAANPVLPRSQWRKVNRRDLLSPVKIKDQNGYSSCVGNGSTAGLERARVIRGMTYQDLSAAFTYSRINGGRDNGAVISDALDALQKVGTCLTDECPESDIFHRGTPGSCTRFRIDQGYRLTSFDEMVSALNLEWIVVFGVMVGRNYQHCDANGVRGHDSGPGNHCVMTDGVDQLPDGRWVIDEVGSWGLSNGPWGNGRAYLDEQHFKMGVQWDAFAIQVPTEDPQETNEPPAPVG